MKKFFIILTIGQICLNLFAQNNKNYRIVEKDNKIYYNKNLPVYFWISTDTSSSAENFLLSSERSRKYANPMYFDTEDYNTLQCNTAAKSPNKSGQNITFKIYADSWAPNLDVSFIGKLVSTNPKIFSKKVEIKAKAKDYISGVYAIFYSLNNSNFSKLDKNIVIETSGTYTLKIYAEDFVGNISETKTFNFSIK